MEDADDLRGQLENVISLRSSQDGVLWTIFGAFSAANGILLVALFTTGRFPSGVVGFVISSVGVVQAWVWYRIQDRALRRISVYENIMEQIIPRLWPNSLTLPLWRSVFSRSRLGASRVMRFSVVFFAGAWVSLLIVFFAIAWLSVLNLLP